jgi:hypothetical protein
MSEIQLSLPHDAKAQHQHCSIVVHVKEMLLSQFSHSRYVWPRTLLIVRSIYRRRLNTRVIMLMRGFLFKGKSYFVKTEEDLILSLVLIIPLRRDWFIFNSIYRLSR